MDKRYAHCLDWIDSQAQALEDSTTAWARIASGSYHVAGLKRLAESVKPRFAALAADSCEELPLSPHEVVGPGGEGRPRALGKALRWRKRPRAALQVLLCIHMDVVYGRETEGEIALERLDRERMRGSGLCDAKGGMAILLKALEALERSPFAKGLGWEVLLTPDEEIGSPGSRPLLFEAAARSHLGLLFEPSLPDGRLVGARKGSGNFAVVVRGRSAHAGRNIEEGRNAVVALADLVLQLNRLNDPAAGITVNVGMVEGGGALNRVPDIAVGRFNARVEKAEQQEILLAVFRQAVEELSSKEGFHAELHGSFTSPPKPFAGATRQLGEYLRECGRELGMDVEFVPSGGVCDGNKLAAVGLPNVDSLGARGGGLHGPEEFIFLDSLRERAKLSALLLLKLAAGEIPWKKAASGLAASGSGGKQEAQKGGGPAA